VECYLKEADRVEELIAELTKEESPPVSSKRSGMPS